MNANVVLSYRTDSLNVSGIEIPIEVLGGSQNIKIGELSIKKESIREASDLIKTIDQLQYSTCQDMLTIPSEEKRMKLSERKNQLILLLSQIATGLRDSKNENDYKNVIEKGRNILEKVTK